MSLAWAALAVPVQVVTSLETFAWVVREIGGPDVRTTTLLPPGKSPHGDVQWNPKWQVPLQNAKLLVLAGGGLELAWLGDAVHRSRNPRLRTGKPGYLPLVDSVSSIAVGQGDLLALPLKNPHFWTSPPALIESGAAITRALVGLNPGSADRFLGNQTKFRGMMNQLSSQAHRQLQALRGRGIRVMDHHGEFAYFFSHYGLDYEGALSENALIPSSSALIRSRAKAARARNVTVLLASNPAGDSELKVFQRLSGVQVVKVPVTIAPPFLDYGSLHQHWVEKLIGASGGIAE